MPSGKKSREQRSQVPPPPVRSTGGARKASPRTLAIVGAVVIGVIVAVVLAIVLSQGSSSTTDGSTDGPTLIIASGTPATGSSTSASAITFAADAAALLKGVPQHGLVLGDPNAPVTLVEFVDTQCPVCQSFEVTEMPSLIKKFVRPGDLKIVLKPWNIIDANYPGNDDSLRGQKAIIGAGVQNKAFTYAQLLFDNQGTEGTGWFNDAMFSNIAASIDGLKTTQLADDGNSDATQNQIDAIDAYAASQPQFTGTPSFQLQKSSDPPKFYGTGWGTPPTDSASLEAAINALLK